MKALVLHKPGPIEEEPLQIAEIPEKKPEEDEVLVRVLTCGVCHTDLHVVEGELKAPKLPIIPGHQIIGIVEEVGKDVTHVSTGDLIGIPWLHYFCGECKYCKRGLQNLCENIKFTGFHVNGGFAEYTTAKKTAVYKLPVNVDPVKFAPIMCSGVIGYRALKLTNLSSGAKLGLVGFGSSAHLVLQIAKAEGMEIYVFSRSENHRKQALDMGAVWVGKLGDKLSEKLDGIIVFAPVGETLVESLKYLDKGGILVSAGIYMTDIPSFEYKFLYEERCIKSTANSTDVDVREAIEKAIKYGVVPQVKTYTFEEGNKALKDIKYSRINGSAVLVIGK